MGFLYDCIPSAKERNLILGSQTPVWRRQKFDLLLFHKLMHGRSVFHLSMFYTERASTTGGGSLKAAWFQCEVRINSMGSWWRLCCATFRLLHSQPNSLYSLHLILFLNVLFDVPNVELLILPHEMSHEINVQLMPPPLWRNGRLGWPGRNLSQESWTNKGKTGKTTGTTTLWGEMYITVCGLERLFQTCVHCLHN